MTGGSMDMMISANNNVSAPSALHNKHQDGAMMASPAKEEVVAANLKAKQAHQQAAVTSVGGERKPRPRPQLQHGLNCPRCDSTNTKFCYYNNYNMTQPRYFCKTCRRHWTQGGVLRNVPIGGGGRKSKQQSAAAAAASVGSAQTSASSSSSGGSKKINNNMPQLMMMPTTAMIRTDFPNVLPTIMSSTGSGLELPRSGSDHQHQVSLPFAPLSLPPNPPGTTFLMDVVGGGGFFVDGVSNGMMTLPFVPPPSFGFGAMQVHGHGVMMGGSSTHQGQGMEEVKAPMAGGGYGGVPHGWASTSGGAAQQGHQHQVIDAGDGGNNHHNNKEFYAAAD